MVCQFSIKHYNKNNLTLKWILFTLFAFYKGLTQLGYVQLYKKQLAKTSPLTQSGGNNLLLIVNLFMSQCLLILILKYISPIPNQDERSSNFQLEHFIILGQCLLIDRDRVKAPAKLDLMSQPADSSWKLEPRQHYPF